MIAGRGQRGSAVVEFVWLALLLLVPLLYVVLAVFEAQRSAYAATAAARSASRAYVSAPDPETGLARARAAAALAFRDQGIGTVPFELQIRCGPAPGRCLTPGSVVSARVSTRAVLPLVPPVFGEAPPAVRISAEHRSPYGTYREAR